MSALHRLPGTVGALTLAAALTAAGAGTPAEATTSSSKASAAARAYYRLDGAAVHIKNTRANTVTLRATSSAGWATTTGTDVTAWFVGADGTAAFTDPTGVARATLSADRQRLTILIDASKITGFTGSGSADLYVRPAAGALRATSGRAAYTPLATDVGDYTVPELDVTSDIFGSAYTHGKSTLKEHFGGVVTYDPDTQADLALKLPGLENSKIGTSGAKVELPPATATTPPNTSSRPTGSPTRGPRAEPATPSSRATSPSTPATIRSPIPTAAVSGAAWAATDRATTPST
ncbi:hypothetical protein AB0G32_27560 [Streptomyces sp. NPDC023723]|uniref:hypothetical protein n=1 Tax=Streptomyces sp. NPDC023723 TaxID=3154323 RepID=UPI00340A9792